MHKRGCNCYSVDEEERKFGLHFFLCLFLRSGGILRRGRDFELKSQGAPGLKRDARRRGGFEVCQEV